MFNKSNYQLKLPCLVTNTWKYTCYMQVSNSVRNKGNLLFFFLSSASLISVVCLASAHAHVRNPACCLVCCILPRSLSHPTDLIFKLNINHTTRSCSQCNAKMKRKENNGKGCEGNSQHASRGEGARWKCTVHTVTQHCGPRGCSSNIVRFYSPRIRDTGHHDWWF